MYNNLYKFLKILDNILGIIEKIVMFILCFFFVIIFFAIISFIIYMPGCGFSPLGLSTLICYVPVEPHINELVYIVPNTDMVIRSDYLTDMRYKYDNLLNTWVINMTVITGWAAFFSLTVPWLAAGALVCPLIAGATAASAAITSSVLAEKSLLAFSKMVEAPEIVSSAIEAAHGALISTGSGDPISTILVGTTAITATRMLVIYDVVPNDQLAAAFGAIIGIMFHQVPTLIWVGGFKGLLWNAPAMMSGIMLTNMIGWPLAYYATIGGNLVFGSTFLSNVMAFAPVERMWITGWGWLYGTGMCSSIYASSYLVIKALGLI